MKHMFKAFVCLMAVSISTQAFARASFDEANQSSAQNEDLTKMDAAKLYVRLGWAKLYLADLEKNDTIMGRLGVPAETSFGRTSYAVGVTAVNGGLIGATVALGKKVYKAGKGKESVKSLAQQNVTNFKNIINWKKAAKQGTMTAGSRPSAELIGGARTSISTNTGKIGMSVVRGVGLTIGAGIVGTLIYDGVRTWFQVQHNGEEVEQQKQDLRDFIAYAEDRLAHNEAPAQSESASTEAAE